MAQIDSRLGDMIRSYREKLGLTQEEMAERLQVNLTHYTAAEITRLLSKCSKRECQIILENILTLLKNRDECT